MKDIQNLSLNLYDEELNKVPYFNYGNDYDEPLLEYVAIIAEEYKPPTPEDFECSRYVSTAIDDFVYRYLDGRVVTNSLPKYLNNTEVLQTIKALGYDENQFWYLLMFILDYSTGQCIFGIKQNESPKVQLDRLANEIIGNISSFDEFTNDPIFIKPAQLVFKMPKNIITVDNEIAIAWLALILKNGIETIEDGSKLATSITKLKTVNGMFESESESNQIHIWYFASMFLKFFDLKPPLKVRAKNGSDNSYSKLLLVSRLVYIIGLSKNENFIATDDNLKKCLKQYKNYKINTINGFYL